MKNTQKGIQCVFHKKHTKNIISVFLKEIEKYAILKKDDNNDWWLVSLKFRKTIRSKIQEINVFNNSPRYIKGWFILNKRKIIHRRSFSLFKKIPYSEGINSGQIPENEIKIYK